MTEHPITPPTELVEQWIAEHFRNCGWVDAGDSSGIRRSIATQAAQWGADQELEACLRLVEIDAGEDAYDFARYIRAARRPKPPSLKEQAYDALDTYIYGEPDTKDKERVYNTIRRALEALDD